MQHMIINWREKVNYSKASTSQQHLLSEVKYQIFAKQKKKKNSVNNLFCSCYRKEPFYLSWLYMPVVVLLSFLKDWAIWFSILCSSKFWFLQKVYNQQIKTIHLFKLIKLNRGEENYYYKGNSKKDSSLETPAGDIN